MGNSQQIIEYTDNDKLFDIQYLIDKNLLNDEIIQLYRDGTMTPKEIYNYIFEYNNTSKK